MATSEALTISTAELEELVYGDEFSVGSASVDLSELNFTIEDRGPGGVVSSVMDGPSPAFMPTTFTESWIDQSLERLATDEDIVSTYVGRHRREDVDVVAVSTEEAKNAPATPELGQLYDEEFDADAPPFGIDKDVNAIFSGLNYNLSEVGRELALPAAILTTLGGVTLIASQVYLSLFEGKSFWQSAGQLLKSLNLL